MTRDDRLATEEARRQAQHEAIKKEVGERVQDDVARESHQPEPRDRARAEALAESFRQKAVREVETTEVEIERGAAAARVSQVVDYVFYLVYGFIGLAIVLEALGARESAGFKQFVNAVTAPLLAPFKGLLADPAVGSFQFMLSYVVALVVYVLLHAAINGALRLLAHRKVGV